MKTATENASSLWPARPPSVARSSSPWSARPAAPAVPWAPACCGGGRSPRVHLGVPLLKTRSFSGSRGVGVWDFGLSRPPTECHPRLRGARFGQPPLTAVPRGLVLCVRSAVQNTTAVFCCVRVTSKSVQLKGVWHTIPQRTAQHKNQEIANRSGHALSENPRNRNNE